MTSYIDPHIHMVSRTTDDYKRMALAGCVLVSEPAFWAGFDRSGPEGFRDYFRQLVTFERNRAGLYRIEHHTWLCINAKEAENVALSREVIKMIPEFLDHPSVLGIGEIGLNKNTKNEATVFLEHVDLAAQHRELILVHTPHLADKYQGTRMILDMLRGDRRIVPERVCIDHVEEHTIRPALEAGHWVGMTLYPTTKCTPARAADMVETYGTERIMVNSAGDWGHSDPLAVPEFIFEMRSRGHDEATIRKVVHDNPLAFFGQCPRFSFTPKGVVEESAGV
jgi:predicted metal-dependent TIM-barrel fold hydrolase